MGWSIGFDTRWKRDIGYGVPALCDHPDCDKQIDRGLYYVCGGDPKGGEFGCGLYFCSEHLYLSENKPQLCERCAESEDWFTPKPDLEIWVEWKLQDESWQQWREENPKQVAEMRRQIT